MKKIILVILAMLLMLPSFTAVFAGSGSITAKFLYVSPTGSDTADGSSATPFATIEKAVLAAREYSSTVVINLREGDYKLSLPIKLTAADSNLVIRGVPGENALVTAGNSVPFSAFSTVTDEAFLSKLSDSSARGKIVSVNLADLGITEYGEIKIQGMGAKDAGHAPTLSYNDKPLTIARYPNDGYLSTETAVADGKSGDSYYGSLGRAEFTTADKRYNSWDKNGIWVFGYFQHDWADVTSPCDFNETAGTIYTYVNKNYGLVANRRFYFFNVPEEIDRPGEWYLNRDTGVLYLYPTAEMKAGDHLIFASAENNLFEITNAGNISFENLKFSGTCAKGIYASGSDNIKIYCCEFSSIGSDAVYLSKSSNSGADCTYFHDLGSKGICFKDCGDKKTLTASNSYVTNCEFERFQNYRRTYAPAVDISESVGVYAAHNKIHDAPHFAISYTANDTVFEYNDIYDVCKETRDCGAVYTGRRWDTWGNIFRYNYVHDMKIDSSSTTDLGVHGIYLDDMSSQTNVFGNVFANLPSAGLMGGGRNNRFENNLIVDCNVNINYDQRAAIDNPSTAYPFEGKEYSWNVEHCFTRLRASYYLTDTWKAKYTGNPEWPAVSAQSNMLNDEPEVPKYVVIKDNVVYKSGKRTIAKKVSQYGKVENDYTIYLPNTYFSDYSNNNYTLTSKGLNKIKKNHPDFEDIPFKKMGQAAYVYEDKYVGELSFVATAVQQSNYTSFQKDGRTAVSNHSIYAYARFTGGNTNVSECGFKIENENGISITCPMLSVPSGDAYAIKFVGAGLKPGTYTLQPYLIGADGKTVYGETKSTTLEPVILAGVDDDEEMNAKVTTYEIEAFK